MKRNYLVLLLLVAVLVSFVGCNSNVSETGKVKISVSSSIPKGIESISMDTIEYGIVMRKGSSSEDVVLDTVVPLSNAAYEGSFPVGNYVITVYALNRDGLVIGSGTQDCTVTTGANSVTVNVHETTGDGTFKVSIQGNEGYTLRLQLFKADGDEVFSSDLTYEDGKYATEKNVANGFYRFTITRTDTNKDLIMDTCRIVAGYTTGLEAKFTLESDGTLKIVNDIVKTPKIALSLSSTTLSKEDSLKVSAVVEDLKDYTCFWVVDGTKQGDAGLYADLSLNMTSFEEGEHTVSFFVVKNSLVWSESKTFSVVDRITSIEVEGEVEFWVVGDVLIPSDVNISMLAESKEIAMFHSNLLHIVRNFEERTNLSFDVKNTGEYCYYLEIYKEEQGKTIIYVVLDREVQNCGYVEFSFNQRYTLDQYSSIAFMLCSSEFRGLVTITNDMSSRVVKVEEGSYSQGSHIGCNSKVYCCNIEPSEVVVSAGEAVKVDVTNRPYSTTKFEFPEDVSGMEFIGYANGEAFDWMLTKDNDFTMDWFTGEYSFELYSETIGDYRFVGSANLVDGENTVVLTKEAILYESTAAVVATANYSVEIDTNGFVFPGNLEVLYRIESGNSKEYGKLGVFDSVLQKENSVVGGALGICLVRGGAFAIEADSSTDGDVTKIVLKLVPANGVKPVKGNLVYDFDFTDEYSGKYPIIWLDNERYLIELSGKPDTVKLIPGIYGGGGSLSHGGENNDKWVFAHGFTAVSGQEVEIHLVNER